MSTLYTRLGARYHLHLVFPILVPAIMSTLCPRLGPAIMSTLRPRLSARHHVHLALLPTIMSTLCPRPIANLTLNDTLNLPQLLFLATHLVLGPIFYN